MGEDVKNQRGLSARVRQWARKRNELNTASNDERDGADRYVSEKGIDPQEQCHIVLHADANNLDILKSALALVILRKKLVKRIKKSPPSIKGGCFSMPLRSRDCMDVMREAQAEACTIFPYLLGELTKQGWRPPLRSMLGRVSARAEWEIKRK